MHPSTTEFYRQFTRTIINNILKPYVIFPSIFLGILLGLFLPGLVEFYDNVSSLYLKLLQMLVIPIVLSSIVSSLGSLLMKQTNLAALRKMGLFFVVALAFTSILAVTCALVIHPGEHVRIAGLRALIQAPTVMSGTLNPDGFFDLINSIIPSNIFLAFANGQNLSVLFVAVFLAITLGLQRSKDAEDVIRFSTALYKAFLVMISWVMLGLPIGLLFIFAHSVATAGLMIFILLARLIGTILGVALLMISLQLIIISRKSGHSLLTTIKYMLPPLTVAFSSSSSIATMPTTLKALKEKFHVHPEIADTVLPLGTNFNQQAGAIRFAIVGVFVAQLLGHSISMYEFPIIVLMAIFAGIAASGIPGIACISLIGLVLEPLGLPTAVGMMLLAVIEPIVDPVTTMVNVSGNCATVIALERSFKR